MRDKAQYREALEALEGCEVAGTGGDRLSAALMLMAQMRQNLGELSREIEELLERALALRESDERRGFILHEQGIFLQAQGKYSEAKALLLKALALLEKDPGTEHPSYGTALHNLAAVLMAQGKYGEAEALLRKVLDLKEKKLGVEDPSYGASLHTLAGILEAQGKYDEAEPMLRKAFVIIEKALGVEHPFYGALLHNLASIFQAQGKYGEAEAIVRKALTIAEKAFGVEHPSYDTSLNELGRILHAQKRYPEAEVVLKQAVANAEERLGHDHPSLGVGLMNLGACICAQGRGAEGERFIQRALGIAYAAHGPNHPDTVQILNFLAQSQSKMGKPEARDTARHALEALSQTFGLNHPITQQLAPRLQRIASSAIVSPAPAVPDEALMAQIQSTPGDTDPPDWNARIHAAWEQANRGNPSAALQALVQIAEEAHKAGAPGPEASARIFLGQILLFQNGEHTLAAAELHRALTIAEQLGDESAAAHIRALLAQAEKP